MVTGGRFLNRKEFYKEQKKYGYIIVADTSLQKYDSSKHCRYEKFSYNGEIYVVKPKIQGMITGFIEVGGGKFVAVKKYGGLPVFFLIAILMGSLFVWMFEGESAMADIPIVGELIEDYIGEEAEQEYMTIPGLKETYKLSADNREIYLVNPEGNTVYFKYVLSIDGVRIYETDYIAPDRMVRADLYSILDAGSYPVEVQVATIDTSTHEACNGATLGTNVTVVKD